jgi:hypothetical protein
MIPLKPKFLVPDKMEWLKFHSRNSFETERYFNIPNPKSFNPRGSFNLFFLNTNIGKPVELIITVFYLDTKDRNNINEENIHTRRGKLNFPAHTGIIKDSDEKYFEIFSKIDNKELWKFKFQVTNCEKCSIGIKIA